MPPILLLAGSPASGKSTIAHLLAQRSPKGMHISVDNLRIMVIGGVVHPGPVWSPELTEQLELARRTAVDTALRYRKAGFLVAIDDFWDPHSKLREYDALDSTTDFFRVLLKPPMDIALTRLRERQPHSEMRDHMEDGIRLTYADMEAQTSLVVGQNWHVVDTSTDTIDECVDRIMTLAERSIS